jgi:GR25 family glycosyltransferase involved in LPS biosynthesis
MKVGITANFQFSFFSGGGGSYTLSIAELCKKIGHDVWLVNLNGKQEWWDDLQALKKEFPQVLHLQDWKESNGLQQPLDLLLEVSATVTKEQRGILAKQSIWIVRKPILLSDIENSIYPLTHQRRDLTGLTAIWALDSEVTKDELEYLRVLGRNIPVQHVPTVWSSTAIESHKREINLPDWIQVLASFVQQYKALPAWSTHIPETNTSATSSCTVPLVILREIKKNKKVPLSPYKIHNADHISKSDFFIGNVFKHVQIEDLSGTFVGRQRLVDWVFDPASVILAHARFRSVRPLYLDALWSGIPIVHNSPLLRDVGGLYYYTDNLITEATAQFEKLHSDLLTGQGMFTGDFLSNVRSKIQSRFGVDSQTIQDAWKGAFQSLPAGTASVPKPIAVSPPVASKAGTSENHLHVLFTDMWADFNPSYNMFLLMMREAVRQGNLSLHITGYSQETLPPGLKPQLLVFGPFGSDYQQDKWKGIPKAHFTGENTAAVVEPDVFLNLGFPHADFVDEKYIRLPLWMLEIDWFGCDVARIQNPKPLPIDRCTKVYPEEIGQKKKFCAFVVTNPTNPLRNNSFHWLSQYKQVDSAGRLFNNVGDVIFAGQGGGGGELKKHEFLKQYKFCLAFENASSQGYTTEKLLHAKAAGCIPIYWGDPKVERDFDSAGFLDARRIASAEELISLVKTIDENPSQYLRMMATPALDDYKRDLVRRTLREVAYLLLKGSGVIGKEKLDAIPKAIGGVSTEDAKKIGEALSASEENVPVPVTLPESASPVEKPVLLPNSKKIDFPVIVTYATHQYLASVQQLLAGFSIQQKQIPTLELHVYLANDVPEDARKLLSSNYHDMKFFSVPEHETPPNFSDFWNPQHFAWKIWLYNKVNSDPALKGRLVLYLDAGIFCSRWPQEWLQLANQEGVCVLEDPRQINDQWCHDVFKQKMKMTEEEKQAHQIVAGILAFRAGSPQANVLFSEAYKLAQDRELIVGKKWEGVRDGKPYGHRHDQSILSLLAYRQKIARYPLDEVYCDISLRKTFVTGKCFYVHRGRFVIHQEFAPGIDDVYVINLDRRKDRMEKLFKNMPSLVNRVERISAVEGKRLTLTPELARLFKPHDFMWKKAIMGCALSHLSLWYRLANEKPEISNYLILEDDVKLQPQWEERWKEAQPHIPEDYDILYLGGILPPNRGAFEASKEKVNPYWSRVAPNQIFGQQQPNRYFHWCAYAYVLSKRGAEKVLKLMNLHDGYWTSADHMLCNHVEFMNLYFLDPLVAGCYQDDDPVYANSAFNDFNRVDKFDSDLWNNDERFTQEEIAEKTKQGESLPLQVKDTLIQVMEQMKSVSVKEEVIGQKKESQSSYQQKLRPLITPPPAPSKKRFVCLPEYNLTPETLYEGKWVSELFGKDVPMAIHPVTLEEPSPSDAPILIYMKPHFGKFKALVDKWAADGKDFYLLHLSDEHINDDLEIYNNSHCKGIVRMYDRPDIPAEIRKKVVLIPLGYHYTLKDGSDNPGEKTPRLPFRNMKWSFMGTNWQNRGAILEPFEQIEPHKLLLVDTWESKEKIKREEYISILLDTYFVPCVIGNNNETFRIYEALECGAVPLYVKQNEDDRLADWLFEEIGLMPSSSWDEAVKLIQHMLNDLPLLESYRTMILNRWIVFKKKLGDQIKELLKI